MIYIYGAWKFIQNGPLTIKELSPFAISALSLKKYNSDAHIVSYCSKSCVDLVRDELLNKKVIDGIRVLDIDDQDPIHIRKKVGPFSNNFMPKVNTYWKAMEEFDKFMWLDQDTLVHMNLEKLFARIKGFVGFSRYRRDILSRERELRGLRQFGFKVDKFLKPACCMVCFDKSKSEENYEYVSKRLKNIWESYNSNPELRGLSFNYNDELFLRCCIYECDKEYNIRKYSSRKRKDISMAKGRFVSHNKQSGPDKKESAWLRQKFKDLELNIPFAHRKHKK